MTTFLLALIIATPARAQWSTTYESFFLPGSFNWQFRRNYSAADRLFNAFDFGHAILYETLWTKPNAPVGELEDKWYNRLTKEILVNPPRLPLEEAAVEIEYAKLAPEAKAMFDWAHLIHRQIYDVWADERLAPAQKDTEVARLISYYKTRRDLAFSSHPKSMQLMEAQPYSLAFRRNYPKFNGLIWAYHWLQVGLYEPLLVGKNIDERQTGVLATVARFRQMIENPPTWMPHIMPMTAAIAPTFADRYPEAAIIFDNLHSMHDVVSDILANPSVPRDRKRAEILLAARRYRDDTSYVMTVAAWRDMAHMGSNNMGGPSVGFLPAFPTPTVARGATMATAMASMDHSAMSRSSSDSMPGHDMSKMARPDTTKPATPADHAAMGHTAPTSRDTAANAASTAATLELVMQLLTDSVTRARIGADTALLHRVQSLIAALPVEHRGHLDGMLNDAIRTRPVPAARSGAVRRPSPKAASSSAKKPTAATTKAVPAKPVVKAPAIPPASKKPPNPADPMKGMDHSKMPGMKMAPDTTKKRPPA